MEQLIGTYLRERRNELGLPLRKVATHINIDTSTLSKIEKNERKLNPDLIDKLAECLLLEKDNLSKIHYQNTIISELKEYPELNDVLNIVQEQITQHRLKFDKDWRENEFSNPNATIKIGTMFSGIGAIEYALKRLNLKSEILFASDIDNFAKQSYFANYEISESSWYDDVTSIDGAKYIDKIEEITNVKVGIISTSPERDDTIIRA